MHNLGDLDIDEMVRTLGEISVGAAILRLRQVNISRRRIVEQVPAVKPLVEVALDHVEAVAVPTSAALGAVIASIGDVVAGPRGERLQESGELVASMGPELLRLSGLTRRY